MPLDTRTRFEDPDSAYRAIVEAHRGLDSETSSAVQSAALLLLANHIGDAQILREALALAREAITGTAKS